MKAFDYARAENAQGAAEALKRGYKIKAGGVDVLDMLKERIQPAPDKLVSILALKELGGIAEKDKGLRIGPLTTLREIEQSALLAKAYPALVDSIKQAATPQIRELATAGGNVLQRPRCWYFRSQEHHCLKKGGSTCFAAEGENRYHAIFGQGPCHIVHPSNLAIPLVAANAQFVAKGAKGERTIAAADFFVMPAKSMYTEHTLADDELLTDILLPVLPTKSAYVDFKEKQSFDWPLASAVVALQEGKWSVVLGHVAPVPWRAKAAEELLGGTADITPELAMKAAEAAVADAEPMSDNAWRIMLAKAAVRRALLHACGKESV